MAEMEQGYIDSLIEKAQKAQKEFESYSQEQVDAIVKAMGKIIYDNAELIAKEAVEETGYGRVDSKILKITRCTTAAWHYLHDKKSVGMIDWDPVEKLATYAKPVGVVAALVPTTNPVSTTVSNGMSILKCRNAMIVSPHPRAKKTTIHGVELINEAIRAAGAPENLVQIVDQPSHGSYQRTDDEGRRCCRNRRRTDGQVRILFRPSLLRRWPRQRAGRRGSGLDGLRQAGKAGRRQPLL